MLVAHGSLRKLEKSKDMDDIDETGVQTNGKILRLKVHPHTNICSDFYEELFARMSDSIPVNFNTYDHALKSAE